MMTVVCLLFTDGIILGSKYLSMTIRADMNNGWMEQEKR